MSFIPLVLGPLYLEVLKQAGQRAKETGDLRWHAVFVAGAAVGLGYVAVGVMSPTNVTSIRPFSGGHR